jgi:hypothetical protein
MLVRVMMLLMATCASLFSTFCWADIVITPISAIRQKINLFISQNKLNLGVKVLILNAFFVLLHQRLEYFKKNMVQQIEYRNHGGS